MRKYEWGTRENITLLFLHGMGSTGQNFGELAEYLPEYHVVALDLVDNDHPYPEDSDYLPTSMAEKLGLEIKNLGKQNIFLVGHSWGAHLALYVAKAYPELVKGIILLDGGYIQVGDGNSLEDELKNIEEFHNSIRFSSWEDFIESEKSEMPRWNKALEAGSRSQVKEINGEIRLALPITAAKAVIKGIYAEPTMDIFSQVSSPVLLLRSTLPEEMESFRQKESDAFVKNTPDAEVRIIPDTTHNIYHDAPGEVSENIKDWIHKQKD
ncbi:alpha/beta fold hydrolase [Virgibacillus doumboii]|uniref:alpha/beta fold hydrolase n=1 Tax=Virgibacillus doumboii TaxID=2697503 RepID=UPI0013DFF05C|nr:alpha/beta hydrolase [Virgibacillus doumboii]